jgi:vacuolar-type H+-ATPase subunit I/STV1
MLTAAWLGQGSVYLLVRKRRVATTLMVILAVTSVAAAMLVFFAPLTPAANSFDVTQPVSAQYKDILTRNAAIVALTIILNIYGTITLVGGALYSAWLFWRKKILLNRMLGNILIATGALMPAMAGSFLRLGLVDWLYLSELMGVVLMFAGFSLATASNPIQEQTPVVPSVPS